MSSLRPSRPSAGLVVAIIALIVALGGTSYAAFSLPKNSVGTRQLKKSAVTGEKIAKNAITSVKVKHGSRLAADFKAGQLPVGPKGDKGDPGSQGPKGDTGSKGDPGATHVVERETVKTTNTGNNASAQVQCNKSGDVTGGG